MSAAIKRVQIGDCTLYRGDCLQVMPALGTVGHIICDPPYEKYMHEAKTAHSKDLRTDGANETRALDFASIDHLRAPFTALSAGLCQGWFIAFCTPEGVAKWADEINPSTMKYKRACTWVKPDSTPQMNGQGPAMGAEMFVCAWAGKGHARWNAGGKRGVYTFSTNPTDRDGRHPTEKPWRLMHALIKDFTSSDQLICDPFMGSGSTLVAAAKHRRPAIGIERDPTYFEVACERVAKAYEGNDFFIPSVEPLRQTDIMDMVEAANV